MFPAKYVRLFYKFYLFCLNVTGFWPFDFDTRLRTFKFNAFYLIGPFVLVPYISVNYILSLNILMNSVQTLFKNIVLKMISNLYVSSSLLNVAFIYVTQTFKRKEIQKLVYRTINLHVNVRGCLSWSDMHYLPQLIKFTIKSVVFSGTLLTYLIVSMTLIAPNAINIYTMPGFIIPAFVNKFYPDVHYGGMLLADFYLRRINADLKRILLNATKYDKESVDIADQLDTLAINYVELIEVVNEFNKIVSFRIVLWILLGLFNLLIHLFMEYLFVGVQIRDGHSLNIVISAAGAIVVLYQFMEFWFTASICNSVLRKVDETETILSSGYVQQQPRNDGAFVKSVDLFLNRIKHHNFQISGCGLFSLDLTFLYSIVCSSTTYLIILIQYELAMM